MTLNTSLPSYEKEFGELNFKQGDDARSVYSPAAYLADLLQLLDDYFKDPDLKNRRPDLKTIPLDSKNTFSLIPYLDIVNGLLENRVSITPYKTLQEANYPFNLPFNQDDEKVKLLLQKFNVNREVLYKLFHFQPDPTIIAKSYLGLSAEMFKVITEHAGNTLSREALAKQKNFYNLSADKDFSTLQVVSVFMETTGVSGSELRELLYQNLSLQETALAKLFFINQGLNGYAILDPNEERLIWKKPSNSKPLKNITIEWFSRVNRIIRLSQQTGIALTDLDLILRSCCNNKLNETAIQTIAIIKQIASNYELSIDVVCSFFRNINTVGLGSDDAPTDLFNRIFNVTFSELDQQYFQASTFVPEQYKSFKKLTLSGELFSVNNADTKKRLLKALHISQKDLKFLVTTLEKRLADIQLTADETEFAQDDDLLKKLSLYYRVSMLAQTMDMTIQDFFDLLDLLQQDPTLRQYSNFNPLIHFNIEELNCYKIIANGSIEQSMWLVQMLFSLSSWMQKNQFSSTELKAIQTGEYRTEAEQIVADKKIIVGFNSLYQLFKPVLFKTNYFVSEQINERMARVIYEALQVDEIGLISKKDNRLLFADKEKAEQAIYQALNQLQVVREKDFNGLGVQQKMQDKFFTNLILNGYMKTDGTLIDEALPKSAKKLILNNTFDNTVVFDLIYSIQASLSKNDYTGELTEEFILFLSDLDELELAETAQKELYDNLVYNGYFDDEGSVTDPSFFEQTDNRDLFNANTNLNVDADKIYTLIEAKKTAFDAAECLLKKELFTELPLKDIEVVDLIENLKFNKYINENNAVVNKTALLNLKVIDLNLALMYYPYRHKILTIIQNYLQDFKSRYYTLRTEDFSEIAGKIVSNNIYSHLQSNYLKGDKLTQESLDFFLNEQNANDFSLGQYFDNNTNVIVFKAIMRLINSAQQYCIHANSFEELELTTLDVDNLFDRLVENEYINIDGTLQPDQITYFLNINNALDIALEGFEDFGKDIFFVIHALAKAIQNTVQALVTLYMELAQQQEDVLFSALQELFEISEDRLKIICQHVFNTSESLVEQFVAPVLATLDANDRTNQKPENYRFNIAFNRIQQFARLATKLDLNAVETDIVFRDQSLAEKFPEKIRLPQGIDHFDFLLQLTIDSKQFVELKTKGLFTVIFLYSSQAKKYWLYKADDYQLLTHSNDLAKISPMLANLSIDAAFNDQKGNAWIMTGENFFCQKAGKLKWKKKQKQLGKVNSNFSSIEKIDAAFIDRDNKIYLFSGDQYLRSSADLKTVDEGYPKKIQGNWINEHGLKLPEQYNTSIDAAFLSPDDKLYFFKGQQFIRSDDFHREINVNQFWAKVKNNFENILKIDATFTLNEKIYLFVDNQCITWSYSLENEHGFADEGSIQSLLTLIPNLPDAFKNGIDAIFRGYDDKIHIFKETNTVLCSLDFKIEKEGTTLNKDWGKVSNRIESTGKISAAFSGLNGKAYIFSGTQYFRYSASNFSTVDEGYPKNIAENWGGLNTVDAAFILDGKTYLIGKNKAGKLAYIRYSSNDYSIQDKDYPKLANDNWWADHFNLNSADFTSDFTTPDTVFIGQNGITYLFKDQQYIAYDKLHRWWSQPKVIKDKWADIPFDSIDAAFTGKDGRTYLFSATKYVRYSDKLFNKLDDRYPKIIKHFWGQLKNNILQNNKIDAAATIMSKQVVTENGQKNETINRYTYLFSGNQFFRYSGGNYDIVDEGYPKTIDISLKDEPRFTHLTTRFKNGIDAAFSDCRNVYLFKDMQCTVVSDMEYKVYKNIVNQPVTVVVEDQGTLYIQNSDKWQSLKNLESNTAPLITASAPPPMLRALPENFKETIDAAFIGTDKVTYVFKKGQCYNDLLEKSYPINEEWGREWNNVVVNNYIDTAFVGTDDKTYLFSGDQYFSYTPKKQDKKELPRFVDSHPKSIKDNWGGLYDVNLAFVKDGKTYLLETPDEDGNFRYIRYSSDDYSQPDNDPQSVDISWWEIPERYQEEGFDHVDAVLFEDEHMYLFNQDQFIQYNQDDELWSYPRPVNLIWKGLPFNDETSKEIISVFIGTDSKTYFFSNGYVTSYANNTFTPVEKINLNWGKVRNNILQDNTVDAAVVLDHQITYLFSGDQYVRYSTDDYRFIDDGYPKLMIENFRQEAGFKQLPKRFDKRLKELQTQKLGISGIVANERNRYIFEKQHCHVVSKSMTGKFDINRLGVIKNIVRSSNRVDAAFVNLENQTFLFSGDQYVRYSDTDYDYVDEGYPKSIVEHFPQENPGVTVEGLNTGLDAALQLKTGKLYLFNGKFLYQSGAQNPKKTLAEVIPTGQKTFTTPVNAAFVATDGKAYFFKGGQYIRYSHLDNEFVDEGYPRAIKDNWGNLPATFEEAIDHAFIFEDKTYLVNGNDYVRYSNINYQMIDAIYPQEFTFRWGAWSDYLLSDIKIITEFKTLLQNNFSNNLSLSDLLDLELGYKKEPYQMLSDIFDWDIEQVKWLKRKNAFYNNKLDVEVNFNIELVLKMQAIFNVADKLGTMPSKLYETIYKNGFEANKTALVAQTLYQWLGLKHSDKDWKLLSRELHDQLNQIKHDALLPYVIANDEQVNNARDLFAKLLIDVEMGSEAMTSKIKEAIAALQLYVHRYFVNLELIGLKGSDDAVKREQLKQWWKWMRNYRVWEANRKVFLYPENYIRPELRDTKTPAFIKLEQSLLQGQITQELVTTAFHDYLNEFSMVGNLKITGANEYKDSRYPDNKMLVLFGHTRTEPGQYFYRTARFLPSGNAIWDNWLPVNITINSTRIFPIYAFGRILVFWTEIEAYEESLPLVRTKNSTSKVETSDTILKHRADIKYSFYDFNKQWINPQTLKKGIELEYKIDAAYVEDKNLVAFSGEYCLTTTVLNPQGDVKKIQEIYRHSSFPLKFHNGIDAAVKFGEWLILFKDAECAIGQKANKTDGKDKIKWTKHRISAKFISDIKRDITSHFIVKLLAWQDNEQSFDNRRYKSGVSAAFTFAQTICLIDNEGLPIFFDLQDNGSFKEQQKNISGNPFWDSFIRIITRDLLRLEPVDAVFEDENDIFYVLRNGQYECYQQNKNPLLPLEKLDGFPKPIKGNLSFNMDKFFNKLHVVETTEKVETTEQVETSENEEKYIRLSYISPEANTALLSGKINSDFTFEENNLRVDYFKHFLLQWSKNFLNSLSSVYQPSSHLTIKIIISNTQDDVNELVDGAKRLINWEQGLPKFEQAIKLIQKIIDNQNKLIDKEKDEKVIISQQKVSEIRETITQSKKFIKQADDPGLSQAVDDLSNAFEEFVSSEIESFQEETFAFLEEKQTHAQSEVDKIFLLNELRDLRIRFSAIKRSIGEQLDVDEKHLSLHNQNHSSYNTLIVPLNSFNFSNEIKQLLKEINTTLSEYASNIRVAIANNRRIEIPHTVQKQSTQAIKNQLAATNKAIDTFKTNLDDLHEIAQSLENIKTELFDVIGEKINNLKELYYGKYDIFPDKFKIENQTNFTFGEPDWYIFEAKKGTFLCKPLDATDSPNYEIIRITTTTIPKLSGYLFSGGIDKLLMLDSQKEHELPNFKTTTSSETTIRYDSSKIKKIPDSSSLDYKSANTNYYWEIFFHAPFLIAQTLNGAQKFEDAKVWYEYIFDPTTLQKGEHWRFLPFSQLASDLAIPDSDLPAQLNNPLDIQDLQAEIQVYLNDPFDPHAIARIRQIAYQKSIIMRYVDNLLDWGDMLFRLYTMESINEARMIYILAYDLLGNKPESLGKKIIPETRNYNDLRNPTIDKTDLQLETTEQTNSHTSELTVVEDTVHRTVSSPYFHIPENELFLDYWNRVEDRLYKIRNSLNIEGIKQALPLFQPPIDPMSIVQSIAAGGSLSQIMGGMNVIIPHYRFNFMFYKTKELVQTLSQFGGELLDAIEKQDSEQLSLMQHKQEAVILTMMTKVKEAQITDAKENIVSLEASLKMVKANETYNRETYDTGLVDAEIAQLTLMSAAVVANIVSVIASTVASFGGAAPDAMIGPFIAGVKVGGAQVHDVASSIAELSQTTGEALSIGGELAGIVAQHERMIADVKHQVDTAIYDIKQIEAQILGAQQQLKIAEYELAIHEKEMQQHQSISNFMTSKFSNEQLYQWMSSQLSSLYYQTYKMAYDMAKATEKAFQFERGLKESEVNYISSMYWNSQRKGLMAGDSLGLDLDRMEQAFIQTDNRRFEISKSISLLELDPMAFLRFKTRGVCEFEFSEALFDYDFQGHYCRQIKTIEISFDAGEGKTVNATLTQLNNKTIMEADPKAVKYLLELRDTQPLSIRSDWKASQQIVLSHVDQYEKGNGLFEMRYDDDKYLPFEGTGAVSRWLLEMNGKRGSVNMDQLVDLVINVKYTALQGGKVFADSVRGLLKPYETVRFFDFNVDFHDDWVNFLSNEEQSLTLNFSRDHFPNMANGRITGTFTKLERLGTGNISLMLNNDEALILNDEQFLETTGLSVSNNGSAWTFTVQGDKANLSTVLLVMGYKARL